MKNKLYDSACAAARAVNYESIGTVEFLVTGNNFYFLEMNTRLQVEHSVTEEITGVDLVQLQLDIATTGKLPFEQKALPSMKDITQRGHAIECRLYAEDPEQNFMPSTGIISHLVLPNGPTLRIDHDLEEGTEITPFFDPMIGKLTTYGLTRDQAVAFMREALATMAISGIKTNRDFLLSLLNAPFFLEGAIDTQLLSREVVPSRKAVPSREVAPSRTKLTAKDVQTTSAQLPAEVIEGLRKLIQSSQEKAKRNAQQKQNRAPHKNLWRLQQWK